MKNIKTKGIPETKEEKKERLRKRRNSLAKLDYKHKKSMKLIKSHDWAGLRKHEKMPKFESK